MNDTPYLNGHDAEPPPPAHEFDGYDAVPPWAETQNTPHDPSALPIVYYDDIKGGQETDDFVEDLLVKQSAIILYGESNSTKTFFATDMALHIATGKPFFGREVTQGGVVYVILEGGQGFNNRIEAWRREKGEDTPASFAAIPHTVDLLHSDADTPRLIAAINTAAASFDMPVALVVIDTLSRAMAGGNENAPDDMGALVMNIDRIRIATKAAVLCVHHSGKDTAKGARGHSLLRAAVDTEIEVVTNDTTRTATVTKQRELERSGTFNYTGAENPSRPASSNPHKTKNQADHRPFSKDRPHSPWKPSTIP
jgi:RecA-family ATPase